MSLLVGALATNKLNLERIPSKLIMFSKLETLEQDVKYVQK